MQTKTLTFVAITLALLLAAFMAYTVNQNSKSVTAFVNVSGLDLEQNFVEYDIKIINSSDSAVILERSDKLLYINGQLHSDNDAISKEPITIKAKEAIWLKSRQGFDSSVGKIKFGAKFKLLSATSKENIIYSNILFGSIDASGDEPFKMIVSKLDLILNKAEAIVVYDGAYNDLIANL